ncbi:hypothetical protein DAPPUDRAFT_226650 [Daphnia pulex]|uniref:T-complex protein 1 subunit theta n=1 Tax=Daphnia pulex TaxID=6669 RepID=E9H123_DAPPU|nr:hypothetical protein DAPPUDRAFT_226650 [Daphnia pulex]|eukprot:EFX74597.1 hypothetical protein DAPPUDRAFT_226650 [Daphnia pulex]
MAMHVPKPPGFQQMMKEGSRMFQGLEEAVIRNISACKQLAETVQTAYGPIGMNKMVINHLGKLFVTNDAATIIRELDVEHPAAKMMILGSQMQEQEVGDGTNFVIILAGALLEQAEALIRMGLTPNEIAEGYEKALEKALEILPNLVCQTVENVQDSDVITKAITAAIMSKQYGNESFLTPLITEACVSILPDKKTTFNVDNVRVSKILGGSLYQSQVVQGMVFKRQVEGDITRAEKAKIAVYTCPIDSVQTETKGTVLIQSSKELIDFSRGEENMLEKEIAAIAAAGVKVIVSGGKIGDLCLHYLNKYGIMGVRLQSKFDLRRLCKAINATALPRLTPPSAEEVGYADHIYTDESRIATIIVRGATDNFLDDIERAIDDGINNFKVLSRDGRLVPGAGAVEVELARQINQFADKCPGLDQYAIQRFAQALETFPRILSDNAGLKTTETVAALLAAHQEGKATTGICVDDQGGLIDAVESGVVDLFAAKYWGMKYATAAACTVLRVDQIIMAKRAGGPKPRDAGAQDADDD